MAARDTARRSSTDGPSHDGVRGEASGETDRRPRGAAHRRRARPPLRARRRATAWTRPGERRGRRGPAPARAAATSPAAAAPPHGGDRGDGADTGDGRRPPARRARPRWRAGEPEAGERAGSDRRRDAARAGWRTPATVQASALSGRRGSAAAQARADCRAGRWQAAGRDRNGCHAGAPAAADSAIRRRSPRTAPGPAPGSTPAASARPARAPSGPAPRPPSPPPRSSS